MTAVAIRAGLYAVVAGVAISWLGRLVGGRAGSARRDPWTLLGLLTWRPFRRWRALLVVGGVIFVAVTRLGLAGGMVAFGLAVAAMLVGAFDAAIGRARTVGVADQLLWSAVEGGVRAPGKRLLHSPYPLPVRAVAFGVNVRVTVAVPPGLTVDMIAAAAPALGGGLRAQAVVVRPDADQPMARAEVDVLYRRLVPPPPPERIDPPAAESAIVVGHGMSGPVLWDLDDEVHLGIFGPTGAGKGVEARWVALQWLASGREVVFVDGQGSAEWRAYEGVPGVTLAAFNPADPVGSLGRIAEVLERFLVDAAAVAELCHAHDVDSWRHLPAEVKAQHPRRLLMADELTAMLGRVPAKDPTADLRKRIGHQLGTALRTVRKAGAHMVVVDQVIYAGDETYLPGGSLGQVGRWVLIGSADATVTEMVAGTARLPWVADRPGLGVTGRRGDPAPLPIEIPFVNRPCLERTIAPWRPTEKEVSA